MQRIYVRTVWSNQPHCAGLGESGLKSLHAGAVSHSSRCRTLCSLSIQAFNVQLAQTGESYSAAVRFEDP
jgi:hypothetical protein